MEIIVSKKSMKKFIFERYKTRMRKFNFDQSMEIIVSKKSMKKFIFERYKTRNGYEIMN